MTLKKYDLIETKRIYLSFLSDQEKQLVDQKVRELWNTDVFTREGLKLLAINLLIATHTD